jgi:TfoX/Sxy family transcriptional regulator of competence genes
MPYDPGLAARIEEQLHECSGFVEKKMFGGIGWLLHGNMCVGVYKEWLITRVGEEKARILCQSKSVKIMDITGKPMKAWTMIAPEAVEEEQDLKRYISYAIDFVVTLAPKPSSL